MVEGSARSKTLAAALVVAAMSIALGAAPPALGASWGQYGLNPWHSSYNAKEKTLTRGDVAGLKLAWSRRTSAAGGGFATPVVSEQRVFTGPRLGGDISLVKLSAFAVSDGARRWSAFTCDGSGVFSLVYANGTVVETSIGLEVAAQDGLTGEPLGCEDGAAEGELTATGSMLVYAIANLVGQEPQDLSGPVWESQIGLATGIARPAAVLQGVVYAARGATLAALSQQTGAVDWSRPIDTTCGCLSAPSVKPDGSAVYIGGGVLYALRTATGGTIWTQKRVARASAPADANGVLYVNSASKAAPGLYAVDAASGAVLWRNAHLGATRTTPTVANGVVYDVSHRGVLKMLDRNTGAIVASIHEPHGVAFAHSARSQVVVVNGTVYLETASTKTRNYLDAFQ